jgi:hypothetical protein
MKKDGKLELKKFNITDNYDIRKFMRNKNTIPMITK